ncbi:hypothetical protein ABZY44_23340 [Streptomyces sp. NPDC006544]|uniref:hypothetical protein n=1 Tax=Streptomyces sp. NPDC006544 TaxID=3154583 RepID=UPI0033A59CDB
MAEDPASTGTRLNGVDGVPPGLVAPGGGGSLFGSSPAEKTAAANTVETELEPSTKKAADGAKELTNAAARTLDGWETASGLKKVSEMWGRQVQMLMGRLSGEKASLRAALGMFVQKDVQTGDGLRALGPKSKPDGL